MKATRDAGAEGAAVAAPLLECREVIKRFGGVAAVERVSLSIGSAGLFSLLGPNGAGKTTLFNVLAGALPSDGGSVLLTGRDVSKLGANERARLGIARTWQMVHLIEDRTVLDNVALGCLPTHRRTAVGALFRSDLRTAREHALSTLETLGMRSIANQRAEHLTLEGHRMVELARAVSSGPAIILADEPASGLSTRQRESLGEFLTRIAVKRTVLMVEHDLDLVETISSHIFVMIEGRIVFDGSVDAFRHSDARASLRWNRGKEGEGESSVHEGQENR